MSPTADILVVGAGPTGLALALQAHDHGARVRIISPAGTETIDCGYVAGCDGPVSTVRRWAGIAWPGGSYAEEVVLADIELDPGLDHGVTHVVASRPGLLLVFALGEHATWRLLTTRPAGHDSLPFGRAGPPVSANELQVLLDDAGLGVRKLVRA